MHAPFASCLGHLPPLLTACPPSKFAFLLASQVSPIHMTSLWRQTELTIQLPASFQLWQTVFKQLPVPCRKGLDEATSMLLGPASTSPRRHAQRRHYYYLRASWCRDLQTTELKEAWSALREPSGECSNLQDDRWASKPLITPSMHAHHCISWEEMTAGHKIQWLHAIT